MAVCIPENAEYFGKHAGAKVAVNDIAAERACGACSSIYMQRVSVARNLGIGINLFLCETEFVAELVTDLEHFIEMVFD
jgi:hypothetical protein